MKAIDEIKSALDNMTYYNQRIKEMVNKQFELDMGDKKLGDEMRKDPQIADVRFDCLGAIATDCKLIEALHNDVRKQIEAIKFAKVEE